jgi:hypothetical protein
MIDAPQLVHRAYGEHALFADDGNPVTDGMQRIKIMGP